MDRCQAESLVSRAQPRNCRYSKAQSPLSLLTSSVDDQHLAAGDLVGSLEAKGSYSGLCGAVKRRPARMPLGWSPCQSPGWRQERRTRLLGEEVLVPALADGAVGRCRGFEATTTASSSALMAKPTPKSPRCRPHHQARCWRR